MKRAHLLTTPMIIELPSRVELEYVLRNAAFELDEETGELYIHSSNVIPNFQLCTEVCYAWKSTVVLTGVAEPELAPLDDPDQYRAEIVFDRNIYMIFPKDVVTDHTGNGGMRFTFHTIQLTVHK